MATVSFNKRVYVTDPKIASKLKQELETPVPYSRKESANISQHIEEDSKEWISKFLDSKN